MGKTTIHLIEDLKSHLDNKKKLLVKADKRKIKNIMIRASLGAYHKYLSRHYKPQDVLVDELNWDDVKWIRQKVVDGYYSSETVKDKPTYAEYLVYFESIII